MFAVQHGRSRRDDQHDRGAITRGAGTTL
jgi:hypothetical protein